MKDWETDSTLYFYNNHFYPKLILLHLSFYLIFKEEIVKTGLTTVQYLLVIMEERV